MATPAVSVLVGVLGQPRNCCHQSTDEQPTDYNRNQQQESHTAEARCYVVVRGWLVNLYIPLHFSFDPRKRLRIVSAQCVHDSGSRHARRKDHSSNAGHIVMLRRFREPIEEICAARGARIRVEGYREFGEFNGRKPNYAEHPKRRKCYSDLLPNCEALRHFNSKGTLDRMASHHWREARLRCNVGSSKPLRGSTLRALK